MNALRIAQNIDDLIAGTLFFIYRVVQSYIAVALAPVRGSVRVVTTQKGVNSRSALLVAFCFIIVATSPRWGAEYVESSTIDPSSWRILIIIISLFIAVDLICATIGDWVEHLPRRRLRSANMVRMSVATGIISFGLWAAVDRAYVVWVFGDVPPSEHGQLVRAVHEFISILWILAFWPALGTGRAIARKRLPAPKIPRCLVFGAGFIAFVVGAGLMLTGWVALWVRIGGEMFPDRSDRIDVHNLSCALLDSGRLRFVGAIENDTDDPVVISDRNLEARLSPETRGDAQHTRLSPGLIDTGVLILPAGDMGPLSFDAALPAGTELQPNMRCTLSIRYRTRSYFGDSSRINAASLSRGSAEP